MPAFVDIKKLKGFKEFDKKVLAIDPSIVKHELANYIAYSIKIKNRKTGKPFMRLHKSKNKLTLALNFERVQPQYRVKYSLKDNSRRQGHELAVKRPRFSLKCLETDFLNIVKETFEYNVKD